MELFAVGLAVGAGAVMLVKNGRSYTKKAVGWVARQSGWIVARAKSDLETLRRTAREEFERERSANPPPRAPDVVVPSEKIKAVSPPPS